MRGISTSDEVYCKRWGEGLQTCPPVSCITMLTRIYQDYSHWKICQCHFVSYLPRQLFLLKIPQLLRMPPIVAAANVDFAVNKLFETCLWLIHPYLSYCNSIDHLTINLSHKDDYNGPDSFIGRERHHVYENFYPTLIILITKHTGRGCVIPESIYLPAAVET